MPNFASFLHKRQTMLQPTRLLVYSLLTLTLLTSWKSAQASTPQNTLQNTPASLLTLGLLTSWKSAQANTLQNTPQNTPQNIPQNTPQNAPQNTPAELKNLLTQIDAAASQRNIKAVMQFYSPNFTHSDGLTHQNMEKALTALWQRYPQLKYSTQVQSWKSEGNTIVADTVTNITGMPSFNRENSVFNATIRSRQHIAGGKIIRQDILSERTQLTSGTKPPKVEFKLPQQVKVGQQFNLDAIVQEPLGDDYLLGTALEEPVKPDKLLTPTPVDLELLTSGGIFKVGRAPAVPGSQWVSAVIMRGDGMVMITQRIQVVKN
ncbi:nuclear transport factor 2 family protein [Brasilonema sp. UFV-L1]|uniref:nuclear transport factor 2 family protein n=1 Tax=Brasilonema sp. UFV-L1 TaxID=2234130 RepID=UPI00145F6952|nr:nuclear transport factor 2 family protein [Brasilonema sp. UFV-L1]NMG08890.1 nuclear transport factor 2 family protein [Brasilonema sp. UFV-L1]